MAEHDSRGGALRTEFERCRRVLLGFSQELHADFSYPAIASAMQAVGAELLACHLVSHAKRLHDLEEHDG